MPQDKSAQQDEARANLTAELAQRVHNGEMSYSEAEAMLARVEAGRYYRQIEKAEKEAARDLHAALTYVDEHQTAQGHKHFMADAMTKQAAYAALRKATTDGWMKAEAARPKPEPKPFVCPMRRPKPAGPTP